MTEKFNHHHHHHHLLSDPFFSDPACGVSPAEKLSPEHLQLLRNAFTSPKTRVHIHGGKSRRNRGENGERGMKFEEFQEVLRSVIGPDIEDLWVERFFNEVNTLCPKKKHSLASRF